MENLVFCLNSQKVLFLLKVLQCHGLTDHFNYFTELCQLTNFKVQGLPGRINCLFILSKMFHIFIEPYGPLPVFEKSQHWKFSWASWIQSTPSHPVSRWSILILFYHLYGILKSRGFYTMRCYCLWTTEFYDFKRKTVNKDGDLQRM